MIEYDIKMSKVSLEFYKIISRLKVEPKDLDSMMNDPIEEIEDRRNALVIVREKIPTAYITRDDERLFKEVIDKSLRRLYVIYTYARNCSGNIEKEKAGAYTEGLVTGGSFGLAGGVLLGDILRDMQETGGGEVK